VSTATRAVVARSFADERVRTASFATFFALIAFAQTYGYRHSYPTLADRAAFARTFGANRTLQLFYGVPHDLLSVGGYVAWRVGGIASIFAAVWGLLAAVRALRAEEDAGRRELVLAGTIGRGAAYLASLAAVAAGAAVLWFGLFLGLLAGRLPAGGSAYLALATVSAVPVFAAVGALASQVAGSRRVALELSTAVLAIAFLLRVVADTSTRLEPLRWATPLGWVEELRAFADPRPAVLLLPAAATGLLVAVAALVNGRRDVGRGLLERDDTAPPSPRLLSSPGALALRGQRGTVAAWLAAVGVFALVFGVLSASFTKANIPAALREQLERLGISIATPAGALGLYFLVFVLAVALFACGQLAAIRREEADQQLETLLALPLGRTRWLAERLLVAGGGAAVLALTAGVLAWAGAASQGVDVTLLRMLEAGANCLPASLLFLGLGTLAFALVPRASAGVAYGLVSVAFVWQLVGGVLGAPGWLLDLSPFQHVALVPAQPFGAGSAAAMLALAAAAVVAAAAAFGRRDLTSA
jgi:ABC-2 type transport system permease protein